MKKITPQTSALPYLDSKLYIKELKGSLSSFATLTKEYLLGIDHTNKACKDHSMHITDPTKPQLHLLRDPLLILLGLHPLLGPMHLNIIPIHPTSHFNLTISQNISGIPHPKGGGPSSTRVQLYCLHHPPNNNSCTLLHLGNPRCVPNPI